MKGKDKIGNIQGRKGKISLHSRCFCLFSLPVLLLPLPFCLSFLFPLALSFYRLSLTSPSPFLKGIKVVTQMITQTRVAIETQSCDQSRHAQTTTKRWIRNQRWKELQLALLVPQCISLKFKLLKIGEQHETQAERGRENGTLKSQDERL